MLFFILYKIGSIIALTLPVKVSYKLASLLADIKYFFSFRERKEIVENLRIVLPDKDTKTLKRCSREIFRNFSKYLVDFFRFEKLNKEYIARNIEIINKEYVDRALEKGKGVIIIAAHLGNWELGGAIMGVLGYKTNVIALDHKNKMVNDFFVNQRRMKNENVISIGVALKKCFAALKKNEVLCILGDKDFTNHGTVINFFGKATLLPKGPAAFSLKTGAEIVPGAVIRHDNYYSKLVFDAPIKYEPTGNFEEDVKILTGRCGKVLENYIRLYPTQWYCFNRFWQ